LRSNYTTLNYKFHIAVTVTVICFWAIPTLQAQENKNFLPFFLKDSVEVERLANTFSIAIKNSYITPASIKSDYKKNYHAIRENAAEEAKHLIKYTALLDTIIAPYLEGIFKNIISLNPQFKNNKLLVVRSPVENAFAMGDGTIFFNIGLLGSLKNESQIAFIMCHELSHGYFNHIHKGVNNYLSSLYNKDLQKEYDKITRKGYNKNKLVKDLMMKVTLNNLYHSRNQESQADSMAFFLMKNAKYDVSQAYTALGVLDVMEDLSQPAHHTSFSSINCEDFSRLVLTDSNKPKSIFNVSVEHSNGDTLRTHPDCKLRMQAIKKLMVLTGNDTTNIVEQIPDKQLLKVTHAARLESLQSWYEHEYYDKSLYYALLQLSNSPDNNYLKSIILLSLYQLKYHLQKHEYADVVSNTSLSNPESLNNFLGFLHTLRISDFPKIKVCIDQNYTTTPTQNEFIIAANFAAAMLEDDQDKAKKIAQQYKSIYPKGYFNKMIQRIN